MDPAVSLQRAARAREWAAQRMAASAAVCFRAWGRIASCQKRISRRAFRGGSALDPRIAKIRAALLAGALPRINHKAWAGRAMGDHACICCSSVIARDDAEYESPALPGRYAHIACFTVWRAESARLEQADGGVPGATAAGA
jgi:hypothetical protein